MKFLVVLAVMVACASADSPPGRALADAFKRRHRSVESESPIIRYFNDATPEGDFRYGYETGNGINAQVEGSVKNANTDQATLEVKGTYGYTSPDGTPVEETWTADENGFQAYGSHVPVGPAIPDLILRGLQYIRDHPAPVERVYSKPQ